MDIKANIIPATSLGGFTIGKNILEYSMVIEKYFVENKLKYEQVNIFSTRYSFMDIPIEINVDTRTGLVYKISALEGYLGKFFNSIEIGSSANSVFGLDQGFFYDECEEAILSKKVEGIALELNEEDPLPEEVNYLSVNVITIFDPEVFKPGNGQN
jgi:hypothetical protein